MRTVRLGSLLLVLSLLLTTTHAAPPPGWTDDYAKAVEKAKTEKKNLLLDFTGSDWCGYCMALDKEVFHTTKFKSWAQQNVVLVQVDFPQGKKLTKRVTEQNAKLQGQYKANGYPTILIVDPEGKELARKVGYSPGSGPDAYIQALDERIAKKTPATGTN
jgi:thioredoxin-related protein